MLWQCAQFSFDTQSPVVMGILNLTPDSFSDGGLYNTPDAAYAHAHQMIDEGARIIDVGGESTRPGSEEVSAQEEIERVIEIVRKLANEGICVSIDTRHVSVARAAISAGASIINDISGFRDPEMQKLAVQTNAGLVVMHMQGTPSTMQKNPSYTDVVVEVRDYLCAQAKTLESLGVAKNRICIDPGPGFGKTSKQTIELVRNFQEFARTGYVVMAALSRKSYIGYAYNIDEPCARDDASAAEALMAAELGAGVIRTHNVAKTIEALKNLRPYVLLGLGSNVAIVVQDDEVQEGKIAQLNLAIGRLCAIPDSQIIDISSFYVSEPAYYTAQDSFINCVVLMRTGVPPLELLGYLHAIENALGRVREVENGPRTCDIDILDYQMYHFSTPELTLPHPRICERDFVVKPLSELLPNHVLADGMLVESVPEDKRLGKAQRL